MGKFILLAIAVTIAFYTVGMFNEADRERQGAEVFAVCNASRMVASNADAADCAQVQDHYGFEFLCEANDNKVSTKCWVEDKR